MAKKKKLSKFWRGYIISFSILAFLLAILLIVGYNMMIDYDETQSFPSVNADNYAKTLTKGSYGLICNNPRSAASVFENAEYSELINDKLAGSVITSEKGYSSDRYNKPVYKIRADGEAVADLVYKVKKETSTFGFDVYDFDYVEPLIKGDYVIDFIIPSDSVATLNGVEVSEYWRAKNVKKDQNGKETITVIPEVPMSDIYDPSSDLYGESSPSASVKLKKYRVEGLLKEPVLVVYDKEGKTLPLTFNKDLKAFCTINDVVSIVAPDNFSVSVNGIDITGQDRFIAEKDIVFEDLAVLSKYMSSEVKLVKYIVSGVDVNSVNVVAKNYRGFETPVYLDVEEGYYRVYNNMLKSEDKYTLLNATGMTEEKLIQYAKYYAEFVANDNDRWSTIMPHVMSGSEVYKTFESFWSVLADHNSHWYEDVEIKDISFYSEDAFSARVSFIYWIKGFAGKPDATEDYPTDVTFYYAKKNGTWYISDWEIHSEDSK